MPKSVVRRPAERNRRSGPLPIFVVQAWTDDLFTAHEVVRIRSVLDRQCGFSYPLKVYLGNSAHPRARVTDDVAEVDYVIGIARPWLRYYLKGEGPEPAMDVTTGVTARPGEGFDASAAFTVARLEDMMQGEIVGNFTGAVNITYPGPPTAFEISKDPVFEYATRPNAFPGPGQEAVQTVAPLTGDAAVYSIAGSQLVQPGEQYRTVCGIGSARITGTVAGADVIYAVRVWNVDPTGNRYLIDRGVYRFLGSPGALDVTVPLNGDVWRIRPEDRVVVEVTNGDFPYLRPNNLASATHITGGAITLPTCEAGQLALDLPGQVEQPGGGRLADSGGMNTAGFGVLALLISGGLLIWLRRGGRHRSTG